MCTNSNDHTFSSLLMCMMCWILVAISSENNWEPISSEEEAFFLQAISHIFSKKNPHFLLLVCETTQWECIVSLNSSWAASTPDSNWEVLQNSIDWICLVSSYFAQHTFSTQAAEFELSPYWFSVCESHSWKYISYPWKMLLFSSMKRAVGYHLLISATIMINSHFFLLIVLILLQICGREDT